ncbi:MAG: hypothetical protein HY657_11375 [Acidobacteria bacterium]|nr:hypothetical protein [Acidobacteriota bacterium]
MLTLMFGVEVLRLVLSIEHSDDDAEEDRKNRHAVEYSVVAEISGLTSGDDQRREGRASGPPQRLVHRLDRYTAPDEDLVPVARPQR